MPRPVYTADRQVWRDGGLGEGTRLIPEETAMALTYNGGTYAVMMGTPQNLRDFAVGFSLSEGIVQSPEEIEIARYRGTRRRHRTADVAGIIAAPSASTSDGGISRAHRLRHLRHRVRSRRPCARPRSWPRGRMFAPSEIMAAMAGIAPLQAINIETRAVHAAAFWTPARGIVALREDVGRHNALDKLAGALAQDERFRRRRHRIADQPRLGRDGAEDRRDRRAADGRGVGADRAGGSHGGCRRHHARRHRAIGRF